MLPFFKGVRMQKFKLVSGKIYEFAYAPVTVAWELYCAVVNECKGTGLNLKIASEDTLADVICKNTEALLNIISSKAVLEVIEECAEKNLYDKERFSTDLFEDVNNRGDYIAVLAITALENLKPFFPSHRIIFEMLEAQYLKG